MTFISRPDTDAEFHWNTGALFRQLPTMFVLLHTFTTMHAYSLLFFQKFYVKQMGICEIWLYWTYLALLNYNDLCLLLFLVLVSRIIFWTDWDATFPRIEAASMSGGGRHIVFKDMEIGAWPNGLTLDHLERRIVWTDARLVNSNCSYSHLFILQKIQQSLKKIHLFYYSCGHSIIHEMKYLEI